MGLQGMLLLQLMMLLARSAAAQIAKPGCPDKCGDVSIPYPFGTKAGCSFNENFLIYCNHSFNPPLAFLNGTHINVTKISLVDGHLHILKYIARDCYNKNGTNQLHFETFLSVPNFTISHTQNKFVGVGCDTSAIMQGYQLDNEYYTTGCMSICNNIDYVDESCSGSGCCQVSIPKGLWDIKFSVSSYFNHSYVWKFNPCSYAFVVEEKEFNFSSSYLKDLQKKEKLPMVLEWAIGSDKCKIAQKNETAYLCKGNSTCYENDNGFGYRCKCLKGYQGNPYLNGCQDIDECENSKLNRCEKQEYCVNKEGSYTCSCPKGYYGDGKKDGKGCIANRLQVIQVALGIGICLIVLLVGSSWLYFALKRRKLILLKEKFFQQNGGSMSQQQLSKLSISNSSSSSKIFTSEELEKASNKA